MEFIYYNYMILKPHKLVNLICYKFFFITSLRSMQIIFIIYIKNKKKLFKNNFLFLK